MVVVVVVEEDGGGGDSRWPERKTLRRTGRGKNNTEKNFFSLFSVLSPLQSIETTTTTIHTRTTLTLQCVSFVFTLPKEKEKKKKLNNFSLSSDNRICC